MKNVQAKQTMGAKTGYGLSCCDLTRYKTKAASIHHQLYTPSTNREELTPHHSRKGCICLHTDKHANPSITDGLSRCHTPNLVAHGYPHTHYFVHTSVYCVVVSVGGCTGYGSRAGYGPRRSSHKPITTYSARSVTRGVQQRRAGRSERRGCRV